MPNTKHKRKNGINYGEKTRAGLVFLLLGLGCGLPGIYILVDEGISITTFMDGDISVGLVFSLIGGLSLTGSLYLFMQIAVGFIKNNDSD